MFKSKKGEGLSLTTVVVAILALIVLIVLILILTGRINMFQAGADECPGEKWAVSAQSCYDMGLTPVAKRATGTQYIGAIDFAESGKDASDYEPNKKYFASCCMGEGDSSSGGGTTPAATPAATQAPENS